MGSNTVRNLTWAAVAACIIALFALIKKSTTKPAAEATMTENSSILNSGNAPLTGANPAEISSVPVDTTLSPKGLVGAAGDLAAGAAGAAGAAAGTVADAATDAKNAVASQFSTKGKQLPQSDDQSTYPVEAPTSTKSAKNKVIAKALKPAPKFDAGAKTGDFMVVAGTYASKDNANVQLQRLQKLGFTNAEAVKFENTANYSVVAACYSFRGTADAAVRTLAKNKMPSFVRKRSGEIFKGATPAPAPKPAPKPTSLAKGK